VIVIEGTLFKANNFGTDLNEGIYKRGRGEDWESKGGTEGQGGPVPPVSGGGWGFGGSGVVGVGTGNVKSRASNMVFANGAGALYDVQVGRLGAVWPSST
jgi:hypothetical protein